MGQLFNYPPERFSMVARERLLVTCPISNSIPNQTKPDIFWLKQKTCATVANLWNVVMY